MVCQQVWRPRCGSTVTAAAGCIGRQLVAERRQRGSFRGQDAGSFVLQANAKCIMLCNGTPELSLLHFEHEGGVLVGMGVAVGKQGTVPVSHQLRIGFWTWVLVFCVA